MKQFDSCLMIVVLMLIGIIAAGSVGAVFMQTALESGDMSSEAVDLQSQSIDLQTQDVTEHFRGKSLSDLQSDYSPGRTERYGAGSTDDSPLFAVAVGGSDGDGCNSIQQTSDGGYIAGGYTYSFGAGSHGFLIVKLDASGNVSWAKTLGGSDDDNCVSIQQTSDGGYIAGGYTSSFGAGYDDFLIVKLNASGNVSWARTLGGSSIVIPK